MTDDYEKIQREAMARAAAAALGNDLAAPQPTFTADQAHGVPERPPEPVRAAVMPHPGAPFADQADPPQDAALEQRVEDAVTKALQGLMAGGIGPASFQEALADVDPADSEAALAMLDFLLKTGRLNRVGVLDGGNGYLFAYVEPKGSTKAGYRPGGTQGDRIVDEALEKQRNSDAPRPTRQGMCPGCMSAVAEISGAIVNEAGSSTCTNGGPHGLA